MRIGHRRSVPYRQVKSFHRQRTDAVGQLKFQTHLWIGSREFGQARHQLLTGQGDRSGHTQQTGRLTSQVSHPCEAVGDAFERHAYFLYEALAHLG